MRYTSQNNTREDAASSNLVTGPQSEKLAQDTIRHQSEELLAVLTNLGEGVLLTDGDGNIRAINKALATLLNLDEDQIPALLHKGIKSLPAKLLHLNEKPLAVNDCPIHGALRGKNLNPKEVIMVRQDGKSHNVVISGGSIRDPQTGKVTLAVNVFNDITTIRQLEQERENLTAIIAHDLRGTLTPILTYSDLLSRHAGHTNTLNTRMRKAIESIKVGTLRMRRQIEDLLDTSRLGTGKLALEKRPVNITAFLNALIERLQPTIDGHTIVLTGNEPVPEEIEADPDRLEQIMTNLLSNAVKYSFPDTVIFIEYGVDKNDMLKLSVTNRGDGIETNLLETLFKPYRRLPHPTKEKKIPGTGLGLFITKGLVEAHGGHLWAESIPGAHTTFSFTIPSKVES